LSFDGSDDYVDVADATDLNPTSAITITAWFKADSLALGTYSWPHIVDKGGNGYGYFMLIWHVYENNPSAGFGVFLEGQGQCGVMGTPRLEENTWYFAASVYDGSTVKVYVGTSGLSPLVVTSANYSGNIVPPSDNLNIGRDGSYPSSTERFFDGTIDEVRIYDRALNSDEITNLYLYNAIPEPDPIQEILKFIEKSVADGTLIPVKPGKPGEGQLGALINMIKAAGELIKAEDIAGTCGQLHAALGKTDGQEQPPDFVTGEATAELAQRIQELMVSLGCE